MSCEHLIFNDGPKRVGPFSHAVKAGGFLFVMIPLGDNLEIEPKTDQIHSWLLNEDETNGQQATI